MFLKTHTNDYFLVLEFQKLQKTNNMHVDAFQKNPFSLSLKKIIKSIILIKSYSIKNRISLVLVLAAQLSQNTKNQSLKSYYD
ncbi:hypothetical protein TTHERM_01333210 (macronuclear) [Tetrahymena thermophila SB210]|uniref:Uncharacterized protein n=1 Tax=Tetrahymena thermophila (strain SB210) TaxID=312017 RepID=Q229V0_TETTS|nr:hypothetical protein TTHERM_01333210 [Tetrahymena thermophila SB210]EAR82071.2 hypothetical protein TTHERM_01333210 [Tetrahymena thermophila SB210]|eukprot:XP_001029734.2 hypothetical protein TTHERM_01333210 [Tetrahymena thermophila SB210]